MNVLGIISFKAFPAKMGGQKGAADFYKYLSTDCNVILAASKDNESGNNYPFTILPFLFNHWLGFLNFLHLPALLHQIKKNKIDIIIIEHSYFAWLGLLLKYLSGKTFVIHAHNIETERFRIAKRSWWKLYKHYEQWAHQKADLIFYKCEEDAQYFIHKIGTKHPPYTIIPYGTYHTTIPTTEEKIDAAKLIRTKHSINENELLFLFNGTLDYAPNVDAVKVMMKEIIPQARLNNILFKIILCGNRMKEGLKNEVAAFPEIIDAGYVADIDAYMKGCDAFIQPSAFATGIKTKLVEALANDLFIITTESGARGLHFEYLHQKITMVKDNDINSFIESMQQIKNKKNHHTPIDFFSTFYWQNITHKAFLSLQKL